MASTAAMVFFWRPGAISRSALLTGFLIGAGAAWAGVVCAGMVCAIAAASNKAGITRVFFILLLLKCGKKDSASGAVCATSTRTVLPHARGQGCPHHTDSAAPHLLGASSDRILKTMHAHGGHGHSHGTGRVLCISLGVTMLYVVLLVVAGIRAHSLALLSEAGHNLSDFLALLLSLVAVYLEGRPPSATKTYGYRRAGVLAALVNALSLVAVSFVIFYEALRRIQHPEHVRASVMIWVAAAGVLMNGVRSEEHTSEL